MGWHIEHLGRGATRWQRTVNDNLALYATKDMWVAYDPSKDSGPAIRVDDANSTEDARRTADVWAMTQS